MNIQLTKIKRSHDLTRVYQSQINIDTQTKDCGKAVTDA